MRKMSAIKLKKKEKKQEITKRMTFAQVLEKHPEVASIFFKHGMSCVGCPMAMQESIEQGCLAHGLDPDKIVDELNKKVKKKK